MDYAGKIITKSAPCDKRLKLYFKNESMFGFRVCPRSYPQKVFLCHGSRNVQSEIKEIKQTRTHRLTMPEKSLLTLDFALL